MRILLGILTLLSVVCPLVVLVYLAFRIRAGLLALIDMIEGE